MTSNKQHLSMSAEHGTPKDVISLSRQLLGRIDLDPASSARFNKLVGANKYYSTHINGFVRPWYGNVLLNPPGGTCDEKGKQVFRREGFPGYFYANGKPAKRGRSSVTRWWFKLVTEYELDRVTSAVFVGFSLEVLQRSQSFKGRGLLPTPLDFPCCFPSRRLQFLCDKDGKIVPGKSPTHASVLVYLPPKNLGSIRTYSGEFARVFSSLGQVKI